jgi:hypothetical protein
LLAGVETIELSPPGFSNGWDTISCSESDALRAFLTATAGSPAGADMHQTLEDAGYKLDKYGAKTGYPLYKDSQGKAVHVKYNVNKLYKSKACCTPM